MKPAQAWLQPTFSGVLALMEDFFTNTLATTPSPALLKAMLINGARSANAIYDLQVSDPVNSQGWGSHQPSQ